MGVAEPSGKVGGIDWHAHCEETSRSLSQREALAVDLSFSVQIVVPVGIGPVNLEVEFQADARNDRDSFLMFPITTAERAPWPKKCLAAE
jgi:hypothetical protein